MVGFGDIILGMAVGAGITYAYDHGWITFTPPPVVPAAYARAFAARATNQCPNGKVCWNSKSGVHCRCR